MSGITAQQFYQMIDLLQKLNSTTTSGDSTLETSLNDLLAELQLKANLDEVQPISAVSLPLPTGAATESTLSDISTKLPAGLTVTSNRLQVELPAGGSGLTDSELRATPVPVTVNSSTATRVDVVDTTTYIGTANPGSLISSAVWSIKKMVETGSDLAITWADGNSNFDNIWDDRLTYIYS